MNKKNKLFFLLLLYAFNSSASTLKWKWQHYTSEPSLKTQLTDYVFLKWDQKTDFRTGPFYLDSHFQTEYALDRSKIFYFNAPELYFTYEYKLTKPIYSIHSIELSLGRKVKPWSLADEYWDMGLWNTLSLRNPLHPVTNGLFGSFLTLTAKQWSADFFVGALHLPNQGVQILEKDGEVYSNSRWFSPPYNQVMLKHDFIDIHYLIQSPFIFDLLFQQSYLLSFKTWSKVSETYYWMKWSIADKPVNSLFHITNQNRMIKVGNEIGDTISINQTITFLPVRQRLLSTEWGFDYKSLSSVFTLANTKMKEVDKSPEGWGFTKNQRENFTYFSALLKYKFLPTSFIQVGYLQSWFQNYNIKAKDPKEKLPFILEEYKILDGVSFDWQTEFTSSTGLPRILALNYRYSFLNEGAWLFVKALYYITPKVYTMLTFDILGAKGNEKYFLNKFHHNDYFSWSLAYDF